MFLKWENSVWVCLHLKTEDGNSSCQVLKLTTFGIWLGKPKNSVNFG